MNELKKRFLKFVDIKADDKCWEWKGFKDKDGYGRFGFSINGITGQRANRAAYMIFKGSIPKSILVCHTCDNPSCVNPKHLFLGTVKDNTQDAKLKGRLIKSEQYKKEMSIRNMGTNNGFYGKKHTEETKKNLSFIASKRKLSIETRRKISNSLLGTHRGNKKLKYHQVLEIKNLLNGNMMQKDIATIFNVSTATISMIKNKKTFNY